MSAPKDPIKYQEWKRKISEGMKRVMANPEIRKKISEAHKGKHPSEETKRKMSELKKGEKNPVYGKHWKLSKETRKKMSKTRKGKPSGAKGKHWKWLEESKKKLSKALKGKPKPWMKRDKNPMKRPEVRKKISEALRGEKSSLWQGGKSFEEYPEKFFRMRKAIRERDDYTCQLCGEYPAFDIHHIDYNKKNNEPENLITLCRKCHIKTNYNREYWKNLLQNLFFKK
jgi:hypothetical protein